MLSKALLLKQLYLRKLVGEKYSKSIHFRIKENFTIDKMNLENTIMNCSLCELSKACKEKVVGLNHKNSKIAFVTLKPVLPFSKSESMIKNIANNVFLEENYSLFSIIKCNTNTDIKDSHISICKEYLRTQLDETDSRLVVLFGAESAKYILQNDEDLEDLRGRIISSKNLLNKERDFIVTYAINDLLRNPSLKKFALQDFTHANEFLNR